MPPEQPAGEEAVVVRWIEAIDAVDVDGALACLDPNVAFHPLRLGLEDAYRGHDGVRAWLDGIARLSSRHLIAIGEIRRGADGELLVDGTLSYPDESDVSPFCGAHRFSAGLIVVAHHYLSDAATVERILGPAMRRPCAAFSRAMSCVSGARLGAGGRSP